VASDSPDRADLPDLLGQPDLPVFLDRRWAHKDHPDCLEILELLGPPECRESLAAQVFPELRALLGLLERPVFPDYPDWRELEQEIRGLRALSVRLERLERPDGSVIPDQLDSLGPLVHVD